MILFRPSPAYSLRDKTIVLTGASRGIGVKISQVFAQAGANIIGIARSQGNLERWAESMARYGIQTRAIVFDLRETEKLPELADHIQQAAETLKSGQVDILINNAGIEIYRAFQDYALEEIEATIRVNLLAAMILTRLLLPRLSAQGQIVNMASLASKKGQPYDSAYAASKAGLLMWNHALRQELAGTGKSVSAICPGYVVDEGMMADTGVKAPLLAGRSQSQSVADATLNAVLYRRAEVIVNQDQWMEAATRGLIALEQLFPRLADVTNRWMGITQLNQQRIQSRSS